MTKKVKLAILDRDLKARTYKQFSLNDDGTKIQVKSGGKAHFNPAIDNDSFVELPRRKLLMPWVIEWQRVYFAKNGATKCVNFRTGEVPFPDRKTIMDAAGSEMLRNIGKEKTETSMISYITLGICFLILLKLIGVIA